VGSFPPRRAVRDAPRRPPRCERNTAHRSPARGARVDRGACGLLGEGMEGPLSVALPWGAGVIERHVDPDIHGERATRRRRTRRDGDSLPNGEQSRTASSPAPKGAPQASAPSRPRRAVRDAPRREPRCERNTAHRRAARSARVDRGACELLGEGIEGTAVGGAHLERRGVERHVDPDIHGERATQRRRIATRRGFAPK
jgi:hypothetical protein